MSNQLLVIIDPQNDFTHPYGAYAQRHEIRQIDEAVKRINSLLAFWKKEEVVVVYSDYQIGQFEPGLGIGIPDTFGHQLDDRIAFGNEVVFFRKNQHSAFCCEPFCKFLGSKKVEELFLIGFLAEYCVRSTAIDALENGYKVCLIEDCIGTGDDVQGRKMKMIKELVVKGLRVSRVDETLRDKLGR